MSESKHPARVRAAVKVAPERTEVREFPWPTLGPADGMLRVEASGVGGAEPEVYRSERWQQIIMGHQVVGSIERLGRGAKRFAPGVRVGVPWLHRTDGVCEFCRTDRENLCEHAEFTGWTVDGGYAEYIAAPEDFVYALPEGFPDLHVAPLLCAGIIGFRTLRLSGVQPGGSLAMYGFGAAAHVAIQVARHWNIQVYAVTRHERHQKLARDLGAVWAGGSDDAPPSLVDAALIFAPAGELVPAALKALKRGGTVALGGIHMSPIPEMDYSLLYHERVVRSVANNTRRDGEDFLRVAAEIPIHTEIREYAMSDANQALSDLKTDAIRGAAVLRL